MKGRKRKIDVRARLAESILLFKVILNKGCICNTRNFCKQYYSSKLFKVNETKRSTCFSFTYWQAMYYVVGGGKKAEINEGERG